MTDKQRYIKRAFKTYKENKKRLRECAFDDLKGVDYSRVRLTATRTDGRENALAERVCDVFGLW